MDEKLVEPYIDSPRAPYDNMLSKNADDKKHASQLTNGIWLNQPKNTGKLLKSLKSLVQLCSGANHSLIEELWFTLDTADEDEDDIVVMT